jgi:subtilisin family serine protease
LARTRGFRDGVGTTFATAHVSGIAALVASATPAGSQAAAVRKALVSTAVPLVPNNDGMGDGLVNAEAAVLKMLQPGGP